MARNLAISLARNTFGRQSARPFATAADSALSTESTDFLKWTSPVPQNYKHTNILAGPTTKVSTLPSGLKVATQTVPYAQTSTIGVWIDAGSRFETAENNGTAHFLEHMAFKGTQARSMRQLEEEVENIGGHLNAYTSREQTTYYAKVFKQDNGKAVEILSDILQNSALDERNIQREREVILREMQEVESIPEEVLFDHLHATAFQHSPLGRPILGPADNVKSITKEDLVNYINTHYSASRMVVVGTGAIEHEELLGLVSKSFTSLSLNPTTAKEIAAAAPATFTGSEIRFRDDDLPTIQFAVAVEGAAWNSPDAITLMVMQAMLGAWDSSSSAGVNTATPLGQRISANNMASSYMAFNTNYSDTGLFGLTAICKPEAIEDLTWAMMRELCMLSYSVEEEDVTRAKNQLKASLMMHLDGTSALAEEIGRHLITYGRHIPKEELFARIDAVNASTVRAAGQKYIYDKDVALVSMGPTQFMPDYNWFRRHTYMLRF